MLVKILRLQFGQDFKDKNSYYQPRHTTVFLYILGMKKSIRHMKREMIFSFFQFDLNICMFRIVLFISSYFPNSQVTGEGNEMNFKLLTPENLY